MKSFRYKCPICGTERDSIDTVNNERVYCFKCSDEGNAILMDKVSENTHINAQLLLEDDLK